MKNKFKIINSENEIAVVERLNSREYRVIFNSETICAEIQHYDFIGVENLINSGSWKVLSDYNNFDVLPKEFKFVLKDGEDNCVFNYRDNGFSKNNVFWQEEPCGEGTGTYYTSSMIKGLLKDGEWLMLEDGLVPQDTWTKAVTYHQGEKIIPNDAYKGNLLQTIKQFAEEFDAQVVVCKDGYLVYSDNSTMEAYRANSDEELKEILQAIRVLKKYEGV